MNENIQQDENSTVNSETQVNLSQHAEVVERSWGKMLCVNVQGEFSKTAMNAWRTFWKEVREQKIDMSNFTSILSFSHVDNGKKGAERYTFLAGALVNKNIDNFTTPLEITDTGAGKYAKYILTGSYSQLSQAWPKAFQQAQEAYTLRNCFSVERYANSPEENAEEDLITELYIPVE